MVSTLQGNQLCDRNNSPSEELGLDRIGRQAGEVALGRLIHTSLNYLRWLTPWHPSVKQRLGGLYPLFCPCWWNYLVGLSNLPPEGSWGKIQTTDLHYPMPHHRPNLKITREKGNSSYSQIYSFPNILSVRLRHQPGRTPPLFLIDFY